MAPDGRTSGSIDASIPRSLQACSSHAFSGTLYRDVPDASDGSVHRMPPVNRHAM